MIDKKVYVGLHVTYLLFLSDFNETNFLDKFSKNTQISNIIKIHPVEAECSMLTDGQTSAMLRTHLKIKDLI